MAQTMIPAVYTPRALTEHENIYILEVIAPMFSLPKKIYGNTEQQATRVWNDYAIGKKSTGCLILGYKGAGKTLLASVLCNLAISYRVPVVIVKEIAITTELISFLASLTNCVILFDEFSKIMTYDKQNLFLTMLSDVYNTNKLFIITDNFSENVNGFIIDRPGRIKYRYDFEKLPYDVLLDYLKDFNIKETFKQDLLEVYKNNATFSFDQLAAIVDEHLHYPNETLEDILSILNTASLRKTATYRVVSIEMINNPKNLPIHFNILNKEVTKASVLEQGERKIYIDILVGNDCYYIYIGYDDIKSATKLGENEYELRKEEFKVKIIKTYC